MIGASLHVERGNMRLCNIKNLLSRITTNGSYADSSVGFPLSHGVVDDG